MAFTGTMRPETIARRKRERAQDRRAQHRDTYARIATYAIAGSASGDAAFWTDMLADHRARCPLWARIVARANARTGG